MGTIDDWNQYWNENPDSKVLFTGDDGKSILDFEHFWSKNLPNETEMQSVIDIACGAGALFQIFGDKNEVNSFGLIPLLTSITADKEEISYSCTMPEAIRSCSFDGPNQARSDKDFLTSKNSSDIGSQATFCLHVNLRIDPVFDLMRIVSVSSILLIIRVPLSIEPLVTPLAANITSSVTMSLRL